eukprot:Plantae.Rhodophyta-Purpureofilum_apyrenoidigerum.ctg27454.p1 GENE.Plantae.Rhodophyta-Purpureofilum_apyrenoidigerum.ctg27454~~Plantae.Rhodophyta-Purpureofilum_apyrenoidigerum.ctg27454.p1  ORF type:complete len:354 (-),score=29.75 Plantae.Rhodophyta-Purpureofilum_apyrenoidigerum.ctg27454:308-1369(-)
MGGGSRCRVEMAFTAPTHLPCRAREPPRQNNVICKAKGGGGFRILELGLPFGALVKAARFGWSTAWLVLMNELAPSGSDGEYRRPVASRRRPEPDARFPAEAGRYTLYGGVACPWCHRTFLALALFGMKDKMAVEWLVPGESGLWNLQSPSSDMQTMKDVYRCGDSSYKGRFTAPLLVEAQTGHLVCNESLDLVRFIASEFAGVDAYEIDSDLCQTIHHDINNGVYKCGFAKTQTAYAKNVEALVSALDRMEDILSRQRFLTNDTKPSIADVLLFPTVFRFDSVYAPLFHCHARCIRGDYPNMSRWMRDIYAMDGVAEISDLETTQRNYFENLFPLNPSGIIPMSPPTNLRSL